MQQRITAAVYGVFHVAMTGKTDPVKQGKKNGENEMKKTRIMRGICYVAGLLILAIGIILNTKSGLGVSPIISVSYSIATLTDSNFGNMTFLLYAVFVFVELLLHIHMYRTEGESPSGKSMGVQLGMDALQLPLSLVFTRFMNLFSAWLPEPEGFGWQLLVLLLGITLTGIGAAMSLDMRIIPNPGDGIVQTIADTVHQPVGFTKNCFDLFNICLTIVLSLGFAHHLIGVGLGTVLSVLGVGRVIAAFNALFMKKMQGLTGIAR